MNKKVDIHVGKTLCMVEHPNYYKDSSKVTKVTVTKVGKKYFEVNPSPHRGAKFYIDNLSLVTNYTSRHFLFETEQEYLDRVEKSELIDKISQKFKGMSPVKFPLETLRTIWNIIEKSE